MRLSVVIPVYNTESYLENCLQSVIAQHIPDMEIVLVDDGSTDSSSQLCDDYAHKYKEVICLHISNSGPATAKNVGLEKVSGEYVSFIDSDDCLLPEMYSTLLDSAYKYHADIVCCSYKQIDEEGVWSHTEYTGDLCVYDKEQAVKHLLDKNRIYSQCWTKIYKKKVLDDNHIRFVDGLKTEEDFLFNIQSFVESNIVVLNDKPFYVYTHRKGSLSREYHKEQLMQFCQNMAFRLDYTEKLVLKRLPMLTESCVRHCVAYYNLMLGRIALSSSYHDYEHYFNIGHRYIRNHFRLLFNHHTSCGFSMLGAILLCLLPSKLYYIYRNNKTKPLSF